MHSRVVKTATLRVTDKNGGWTEDSRDVTITKRDTALVYTGAVSGQPNKVVTLAATLSDEYGQPVVGATVAFTVGTQSVNGVTNSSGVASIALKLNQKPGSYAQTATFTGNGLYNAAAPVNRTFSLKK